MEIEAQKILNTREYLLGWNNGELSFVNSSSFGLVHKQRVIEAPQGESGISSVRMASGAYLVALAQGGELHLFELMQGNKAGTGAEFVGYKYVL